MKKVQRMRPVATCLLTVCILLYSLKGDGKVLIIQMMTEGYYRHPWEWDRNKYPVSFVGLSQLSANLYAKRHGYDYKLFLMDEGYLKSLDRDNYWMKPLAVKRALELTVENQIVEEDIQKEPTQDVNKASLYEYVVFVDLDVIFMEVEKSLEEKMREWSHKNDSTASIFIPLDLNKRKNYFPQYLSNKLALCFNSGLIIFHNTARTRRIVQEWWDCPDKIVGCERFRKGLNKGWGSDQTALFYIEKYLEKVVFRNESSSDNLIQRIPCDEANGFSLDLRFDGLSVSNGECGGKFMSHFWGSFAQPTAYPLVMPLLLRELVEVLVRREIFTSKVDLLSTSTASGDGAIELVFDGMSAISPFVTINASFPYGECISCAARALVTLDYPINTSQSVQENYPVEDLYQKLRTVCESYHKDKERVCKHVDANINERIEDKYRLLRGLQRAKKKNIQETHTKEVETRSKVIIVQVANEEQLSRLSSEWDQDKHPYPAALIAPLTVYMYAMRHNYEYKLFLVDEEALRGTRERRDDLKSLAVQGILENSSEAMDSYEYIVYADMNLMVMESEKSLEQKLEEWTNEKKDYKYDVFGDTCHEEKELWIFKNGLKLKSLLQDAEKSQIDIVSRAKDRSTLYLVPCSADPEPNHSDEAPFRQIVIQAAQTISHLIELNHEIILQESLFSEPERNLSIRGNFRNTNDNENPFLHFYLGKWQILDHIRTDVSLEENFLQLPSIIQEIQLNCIVTDPDVCEYVEFNVQERIAKRYNFLKKIEVMRSQTQQDSVQQLLPSHGIQKVNEAEPELLAAIVNSLIAEIPDPIIEPTDLEFETGESIIFVTAFKEMGRSQWKGFERRFEEYCHYFSTMAYYLPEKYFLIIFIEEKTKEYILRYYPELQFKKNLIFHDWNSVTDSFYFKYLKREEEIMASPIYQAKIPDERKGYPEHKYAEYTMMTHSKISFVRKTRELYPNFHYYCWIDFGHLRSQEHLYMLPSSQLNWDRFLHGEFILLTANEIPNTAEIYYDANEMLAEMEPYIIASHMIFPNHMIFDFEKKYEKKIIEWQKEYIADDEQNLILQLLQDYPNMFAIHNSIFYLFFYSYLNGNSQPERNDTIPFEVKDLEIPDYAMLSEVELNSSD